MQRPARAAKGGRGRAGRRRTREEDAAAALVEAYFGHPCDAGSQCAPAVVDPAITNSPVRNFPRSVGITTSSLSLLLPQSSCRHFSPPPAKQQQEHVAIPFAACRCIRSYLCACWRDTGARAPTGTRQTVEGSGGGRSATRRAASATLPASSKQRRPPDLSRAVGKQRNCATTSERVAFSFLLPPFRDRAQEDSPWHIRPVIYL